LPPRSRRSTKPGCALALFAAFFVALSAAPAAAAEAPRWNILFVFADDWGRYASCYRGLDGRPGINDVVETPAVDRLAREGVVFRNAFVNSPSCTPCRSSLLSGRYFFNCGRGAILQGAVWDDAIPTFPLELEKAGYRIGKSFKVWSPGRPADQPFGGQKHAYEKAGRLSNNFSESATRMVADGKTVAEARAAILAEVRGNFEAFLADGAGATPWLYFLGTTTTHRTWVKGSGQALWGIDPARLQGKLPAFLPDVPEIREDVADYLGEVQAVDASLGVLLERLAAAGQLDRTLVVVSGDHGMPGVPAGKCDLYDHGTRVALVARVPGGTPGRVVDDFVSLPDLAPTFMAVGGVAPPTGIAGRSILPLLESDRSGQIDPERTWVITGRERHVAAARDGNLPYPMRALRTADHLYIRNFAPDRLPMGSSGGVTGSTAPDAATLESDTFAAFADMDASPTKAWLVAHRDDPLWSWLYSFAFAERPAEQLYDLRTDPDQLTNVADRPEYAAAKADLSRRLTAILEQAGDPRLAADVPFEQPPFTDASR
jgi:arylsulfatase A-like enzyme